VSLEKCIITSGLVCDKGCRNLGSFTGAIVDWALSFEVASGRLVSYKIHTPQLPTERVSVVHQFDCYYNSRFRSTVDNT